MLVTSSFLIVIFQAGYVQLTEILCALIVTRDPIYIQLRTLVGRNNSVRESRERIKTIMKSKMINKNNKKRIRNTESEIDETKNSWNRSFGFQSIKME